MKEKHPSEDALAPERYELESEPAYLFDLTRRQVLKVFGGGVVVVFALRDAVALQKVTRRRASGAGQLRAARRISLSPFDLTQAARFLEI